MELQVGLQDTSNVLYYASRIEDPVAREAFQSLAKIVDALVVNMRTMSGENIGNQRGNQDPNLLVFSVQDLIDAKVIKKFERRDVSKLLGDSEPPRYIATGYGESSGGKRFRRGRG